MNNTKEEPIEGEVIRHGEPPIPAIPEKEEFRLPTMSKNRDQKGTNISLLPDATKKERWESLYSMAMEYKNEDSLLRRNRFVQEYLYDYSKAKAYQRSSRSGRDVTYQTARSRGLKLYNEPYVQLLILLMTEELAETAIVSRQQVMAGLLKEANDESDDSSQSARVSAWKALGKYLGLDIDRSLSYNVNKTEGGKTQLTAEDEDAFLHKFKEQFQLVSK